MKVFLSLLSLTLFIASFAFHALAKDHGHGHGHGKGHGHYKQYYKKPKHYCNMHCHHGEHHIYREKVVILQPAPRPRPGININLAL